MIDANGWHVCKCPKCNTVLQAAMRTMDCGAWLAIGFQCPVCDKRAGFRVCNIPEFMSRLETVRRKLGE